MMKAWKILEELVKRRRDRLHFGTKAVNESGSLDHPVQAHARHLQALTSSISLKIRVQSHVWQMEPPLRWQTRGWHRGQRSYPQRLRDKRKSHLIRLTKHLFQSLKVTQPWMRPMKGVLNLPRRRTRQRPVCQMSRVE
jgi:hypothetical protein